VPPTSPLVILRPRGRVATRPSADSERGSTAGAKSVIVVLVDIRIGIANSPREISFESAQSPADVEKVVADALDGSKSYFTLSDVKGKVFIVPTAGLAYIEVGSEERGRVGFVS
jgi:hypothetical protein